MEALDKFCYSSGMEAWINSTILQAESLIEHSHGQRYSSG
jgi:hypothetical protein